MACHPEEVPKWLGHRSLTSYRRGFFEAAPQSTELRQTVLGGGSAARHFVRGARGMSANAGEVSNKVERTKPRGDRIAGSCISYKGSKINVRPSELFRSRTTPNMDTSGSVSENPADAILRLVESVDSARKSDLGSDRRSDRAR
jgi:hypothetical protein